jgi:hypothetical protein
MIGGKFRDELQPFVGRQLIDCADELKAVAERHGYTIDPLDHELNTGSIDREPRRLDVILDDNSIITEFSIG